jgi:hypothetical protein
VTYPRFLIAAAVAVAALVVPGAVGAGAKVTQPLIATVGTAETPEAFRISLTDSTGTRITHLDPGTYTINVRDYATLHNFRLTGPGVDQATDIAGTAMTVWVVTFRNGTYNYVCEAHPSSMRGSFTVGTVVTPPPVKKLVARVGPKRTISLKTASGARVKRLTAGRYRITVRDATSADNFHLIGPGVNRKTGVKFRGTRVWTVTFRSGRVSYRSDAHRLMRGSFTVVSPGG